MRPAVTTGEEDFEPPNGSDYEAEAVADASPAVAAGSTLTETPEARATAPQSRALTPTSRLVDPVGDEPPPTPPDQVAAARDEGPGKGGAKASEVKALPAQGGAPAKSPRGAARARTGARARSRRSAGAAAETVHLSWGGTFVASFHRWYLQFCVKNELSPRAVGYSRFTRVAVEELMARVDRGEITEEVWERLFGEEEGEEG